MINLSRFTPSKLLIRRKLSQGSSGTVGSQSTRAGGDQRVKSLLSIPSRQVFRWLRTEQHDSSDSLQVHIDDLANADELNKLARTCPLPSTSNDLIEDADILHGFRLHSQDALTRLTQADIAPNLFRYGERETGRKLLAIAAESGWYEAVLFLLNRDVDINETDREHRTALINCLTTTDTRIITALVKKPECHLDTQSITGHTAAHYAVMMNVSNHEDLSRMKWSVQNTSCFEILIHAGARLDLRNDIGQHVLHQLVVYRRKQCWRIVRDFYRDQQHGFAYLQHLIHAENAQQETCLMLAFQHRPKISFFRELLVFADPALIDKEVFRSWPQARKLIERKRAQKNHKWPSRRECAVGRRHRSEGVEEHLGHSSMAFDFHLSLRMSIERSEPIHSVECENWQLGWRVPYLSHWPNWNEIDLPRKQRRFSLRGILDLLLNVVNVALFIFLQLSFEDSNEFAVVIFVVLE